MCKVYPIYDIEKKGRACGLAQCADNAIILCMNKNIYILCAALALLLLPLTHTQALSATATPPMAPVLAAPAASATVSTRTPGFCTNLDKDLRYGASSDKETKDRVTMLQLFLERENLFGASTLGTFGPVTLAAVKKFQVRYGLPATGFVGPMTRAKIKEISRCGSIIVPPPTRPITVKAPNGGEKWDLNSNQYIQWTTDDAYKNSKFTIYITQRTSGAGCNFTVTPCLSVPVAPMPWLLDKNISGTQYYWIAGTDINDRKIPRGEYVVQICTEDATPVCGYGAAAFKLVDPAYEVNKDPVITEIVGPTSIKLGDTGVWTVKAYDPEGGNLAYEGAWGKSPVDWNASGYAKFDSGNTTEIKFPKAGTYTLEFIAYDNMWKMAKKTVTVTVN